MISTEYRLPKAEQNRKDIARWRKCKRKIFKKYGKKCFKCGVVRNIEVHHLNDRSHHPRQKFTLKNLRPLCLLCHRVSDNSIHSFCGGVREKTTKIDFDEWIG